MQEKIAVIGGGAAGFLAAITSAKNGASVTILERKDRVLKKVLATGNGRCNYTNIYAKKQEYPVGRWGAYPDRHMDGKKI